MRLSSYESLLGHTEERLTGLGKGDIIAPDTLGAEVQPPASFPSGGEDLFPEPNEGSLIEDERFYLEPID